MYFYYIDTFPFLFQHTDPCVKQLSTESLGNIIINKRQPTYAAKMQFKIARNKEWRFCDSQVHAFSLFS